MSCESKGSGEILDEGMVSDLLSGVLNLIRHYMRTFRADKLANGVSKVLNLILTVNCGQCIREKHLFHILNTRSQGLSMQINFHCLL